MIFCYSCSSKKGKDSVIATDVYKSFDSCIAKIHIDSLQTESPVFDYFWMHAEKNGYSFQDDTTSPFIKVIFTPQSSKFYIDTLKIDECRAFDSINIHRINITTNRPGNGYHARLIIEEWEFKNVSSAIYFFKKYGFYIRNGYPLKSPTSVIKKDRSVFVFQTAAYMFIPEMEKMQKLINAQLNDYSSNY